MENLETSKYEIMVIILPELGEEATKKEIDVVRSLITENGGEITHEDMWGEREFAYKIRKQEQGFYFVFNFSMESNKVKNLEDPLNLNQKVLRYLILSLPKHYEIKTLENYEKEAAEEKKEEEKKKAEKIKEKTPRKAPVKPRVKIEKKEEKPSKPLSEEKEEIAPKKKEKKTSASKLSEVDEKLKNIINDPDISL